MTDETEPVPTADDVRAARDEVADVAEQTYAIAAGRLPQRVRGIARTEARKVGWIGSLLSALLAVAISVAAYSTADTARTTSAATAATLDAAMQRLGQANLTLTSRGQEPVPLPPTSSTDPTPAIAAAVLAQVLASLPPSPTADAVAARIQGAVVPSLFGPSQDDLAGQVAAYFALNPPKPGPPPSEAAIRAAVDASLRDNPPPGGPAGPACTPDIPGCSGPPGAQGPPGAPGAVGPDGKNGADSTVPGPAGAQGAAGPTCPPGTSSAAVTFASGQSGVGCVNDGGTP